MNNKYTYVLWSGGMDSTYLIQKLLTDDPNKKIRAGYVELMNNVEKTKMEKDALKKLVPIFQTLYKERFQFWDTVFKCEIMGHGGFPLLVQMPCWINAIISTTKIDDVNEVAIGYVMNDCAISYLKDFQDIVKSYNKISDRKMPKVIFPLSKINKDMICGGLMDELKQHVVSCENPKKEGDKWISCGKCIPCSRNPMILRSKDKKSNFVETFNESSEVKKEIIDPISLAGPGYSMKDSIS